MSDPRQTITSGTSKVTQVSNDLSTNRSSNKFTLTDTSQQLESIKKLTGSRDYLTTELNNNTITNFASPYESSTAGNQQLGAFRMDLKVKKMNNSTNDVKQPVSTSATSSSASSSSSSSSARIVESSETKLTSIDMTKTTTTTTKTNQLGRELTTNQIPSYSSIFSQTQTSYRPLLPPTTNQNQQQQQQPVVKSAPGNGRAQARKLIEADEVPSVATINRQLANSKKLAAYNYSDKNHVDENDDDDGADAEIDERIPFSSSVSKQLRSSLNAKRGSQESHRCSSPGKHSTLAYEHRCDKFNNHSHHYHHPQQLNKQQNPHTKISFNDSRPPSFNMCQSGGYNNETFSSNGRKTDWHDEPVCFNCDTHNCCSKQHKLPVLDGHVNHAHYNIGPHHEHKKSHSRMKSMHLFLKSIILILLTFLLLMLFIGVILASHHLPIMFDRMLNASRSFNVTIAG